MNELFDKLILRIVFTLFICLVLVLYKYAHIILYPSSKRQLFRRFYPSQNPSDTIHLFGRIIAVSIIFSEFYFYISDGIWLALITFLIQASLLFIMFLLSLYIIESVVLFNFEYNDEIIKRKNFSYAIIGLSHSIAIAFMLKTIILISKHNLILMLIIWLFSMVILSFAVKTFSIISKLSFNKLLIQKNAAVAYSYAGFILGWALIISSSINSEIIKLEWYGVQVILKLILSIIIFPIFKQGLIYIFKVQSDNQNKGITESDKYNDLPDMGYGIYEGAIFLSSCLLTSIITGKIYFGNFYPLFQSF